MGLTVPAGPAPDAVDGRNARRDRNRERVLDAAIELFREGRTGASTAELSARAGVSERSLFRYFADVDELVHAAVQHHAARHRPMLDVPADVDATLEARVASFVAHRVDFVDAVGAVAHVAASRGGADDEVTRRLSTVRAELRAQVESVFAPELGRLPPARRRDVVDAVDALCQFEGVRHVRHVLGRSPAATRRVLAATIRSLLGAAG